MRKVCVVITARPSYSRIKTALIAIKNNPNLELQIVVAASAVLTRYGNVCQQIVHDGFEISDKIYSVVEGESEVTSVKTTAIAMLELATVFAKNKPDCVISIADRFETMATAVAASYMNIPLVHIQGGEVTGNIDEKVRHAITKLADLHFVASPMAAKRVEKMGEKPSSIFITGCPSIDLAAKVLENPTLDYDPIEKYGGAGEKKIKPQDYYIVIQHPVTDEASKAKQQVQETLRAMRDLGKPTFWIWPNVDAGSDGTSKGIREFREKEKPENIWFFRDIPSGDWLKLLYNCNAIIGNSSVAIRECSFLGVPAVNIGSRQSGRDRGTNVIDVNPDYDEILGAIAEQKKRERRRSDVYGGGNAGEKMAEILEKVEFTTSKKLAY
ncbi:MAG: UDP-N-acetylglucosamine 2-epimerase (hydrolyzing) [Lachnospiraceae bacterium]|nr:UDP-N-acetylglucosamine 2-epimerase (hydrolyzing) [Lachnospiraceae bacterium]